MKKFLAVILALSMTPVFAQHHHHGGGGGNWVAPLILGGVVGAAIASRPTPPPQVYYTPVPPPVYNPMPTYYQCLVQVYDPVYNIYRNEVATCTR